MTTLLSKMLTLVLISASLLSFTSSSPEASASSAVDRSDAVIHVQGNSDKNEPPKDDQGKNDKKEKPDKEKNKPIAESNDYQVQVACTYDKDLDQSECSFTGVAPEDGKKIGLIQLPATAVCAEIVGGDHEYVDPDPNTNVTGYRSRGNEAAFSLILQGEVTASGSATYWFKVASSVVPASGAGLQCEPAVAEDPAESAPEATATTEPASSSGSLTISTYTCIDVPTEREDYDWFGVCQLLDGPVDYVLTSVDPDTEPAGSGVATATGETTFGELEPGTYRLERTDATWCHAESDNVNGEGDVIITAEAPSNVWTFFCSGE
ncbi:MAG: hypothetical protein WKF81_02995 [Thermomicrobiales bacterium]